MKCLVRAASSAVALFSFVLMSGCGTSQNLAPEPKIVLSKVAVLRVDPPGELYTRNSNLVLNSTGGLLGAGVQALDTSYKSRTFNQKMEEYRLSSGKKMTSALIEELARQGFDVELIDGPKGPPDDPDNVDYTKLPTRNPVLHVRFDAMGMYSSQTSLYYLPQLNVSAWLVMPGSESYPFEEGFYYGADSRGEKYWSLPSDDKYRYGTFETLVNSPDSVAEGYDAGIRAVAKRIGEQLRSRFDRPAAVAGAPAP
ncbi:hypothetical protein OOT46_19510 [Aquabacterium sp. A7-Y]|uniref:hypothetical protein n=1 Tax=Aquabacterium sp. A7-Y TaxID=1349605 RepID=UPI00223CF0F7|nr:hypothetical protein [Aquabacterium sp. A7-Y]MCW7540028.1 hypothetical protein [Aquabacterium sp. A7-Y]